MELTKVLSKKIDLEEWRSLRENMTNSLRRMSSDKCSKTLFVKILTLPKCTIQGPISCYSFYITKSTTKRDSRIIWTNHMGWRNGDQLIEFYLPSKTGSSSLDKMQLFNSKTMHQRMPLSQQSSIAWMRSKYHTKCWMWMIKESKTLNKPYDSSSLTTTP